MYYLDLTSTKHLRTIAGFTYRLALMMNESISHHQATVGVPLAFIRGDLQIT